MSLLSRRNAVALTFRGIGRGVRIPRYRDLQKFDQACATIEAVHRLGVDVVLDVGAQQGMWAEHLRLSGFTGTIHSFEPEPDAFSALQARSAEDPRWHAHDLALGSSTGDREFNVIRFAGDTVLSSFLDSVDHQPSERVAVAMDTLDHFLDSAHVASDRIFLKMDTQGYDHQVLEGLTDKSRIALLQSEVSVIPIYEGMVPYTESLRSYADMGFVLVDLYPVSRTDEGAVVEYDCLMTRPGAG